MSGRALHTGVPSTVRFTLRADDGLGLRFLFPGFAAPLTARDLAGLRRTARRATVLTDPVTGATIRTPEHLLAAALFFARAPLDIACDAAELPGLDGSARPWYTALAAAVPPEYAAPPRQYAAPGWRYEGSEGSLHAEAADHFSVEYTLERGAFCDSFSLTSASAAAAEILPARTFIFWRDWQALTADKTPGASAVDPAVALLGGVDAASGLLLAESPDEHARALAGFPENQENPFPLIHPRALRYPEETARHKVLDLLGDLALNVQTPLALPKLRLVVRNGGHALNHLLLDHLQTPSRSDRP